jgi:tetratricopeptide (TPR) repeat protein
VPSARVLLAALALAACSGPAPPPPALANAERLEHDGQHDQALAAYATAAEACEARRHRYCADAWLGHAAALDRQGRPADAALAYEAAVVRLADQPARAAAALESAARVRLALGEDEVAYRHFWRALTDFPETAAADQALRHLADDGRRRAPRQLYDTLLALYVRLSATPIGDNLLFTAAGLAREPLGDDAAALALYDRLLTAHPQSALWDDACFTAAGLARGLGDGKGALRRYRALAARREVAVMAGSYFSPYGPRTQLEIGRVLRDDLGDRAAAAKELGRLGSLYPDSTLRDDALWEKANSEEAAAACATLSTLRADFPESRWELTLAPALRARLGCR